MPKVLKKEEKIALKTDGLVDSVEKLNDLL